MPFLDSLDIANRALQHCGVNPILSVTEDTTNNNEVSAVYDKVRRAELRRNAWRFAIRKTVIRPLTATTLEIVAPLYSASTTYFIGKIVSDANGLIWISTIAENIGNTPGGNNNAWDMFFGPMTVDVWQAPTQNSIGSSYQAGELVYVPNFQSNLFVNSANLLNSNTWFLVAAVGAAATGVDPLGSLTATTLTDTVANTTHSLQQIITPVVGQTYTWSLYVQAGTLSKLTLSQGGLAQAVTFDVTLGTAINIGGTATGTLVAVGGGWYRCAMTFIAGSSAGFNIYMTNAAGVTSYSGGAGTINIWGPQLDLGSVAQTYNATPPLPQGYTVYMSLTNNNQDTPNVTQAWGATTQYKQDQIVNYAGLNWTSLLPYNVGNTPANAPAVWSATTAYVATNTVTASDNYVYVAAVNTTGNNPVGDAGVHWTNTGVRAAWTNNTSTPQDINWRVLNATLKNIAPLWPVGTGPTNQTTTRNVYRLPAGYVGPAPQNPKQGVMTFLGGPSGNNEPDWEYNGNFVVTVWSQPIIIRFVADITKVTLMDDMFCEGLAARIAQMVCKRVTGSGELTGQISQAYKLFMGEARLKNGIESGTQEPYEDEYVTVRI